MIIKDLLLDCSRLSIIGFMVFTLIFHGNLKELGKSTNIIPLNFASLKKALRYSDQLRDVSKFCTQRMTFCGEIISASKLAKKQEL